MAKSRLGRLLDALDGLPTPPPPKEQEHTHEDEDEDEDEHGPETTEDPDDIYQSQEYKNLPHANPSHLFGDQKVAQAPPKPPPVAQPLLHLHDDDEPFNFHADKGKTAPPGTYFCPFLPIAQYCYRFAPQHRSQSLATAFFDAAKIYKRSWTIYCISSHCTGVVAFVPKSEVDTLLEEINAAFPDEEAISLPVWAEREGLVIGFDDLDLGQRPRLAGVCCSRGQYRSCLSAVNLDPTMSLSTGEGRSLQAFKEKMAAVAEISKKKKKATNARKYHEALIKRQDMARQSLRGQRYLGMHPKADQESLLPDITSLSISAIDPEKPAPHPFDQEPIFIAIDCEAWERPPRMVTEVGVATLDTRDLEGVPPGKNGENWHDFIRGRHMRVIEYKNCVNHQYVQGCPDNFEFGKSEMIAKNSLASTVSDCFKEPFSKDWSKRSAQGIDHPPLGTQPSAQNSQSSKPEERKLILVGHDVSQDVDYLSQIGCHVGRDGRFIDTMDTLDMYRTYHHSPRSTNLGSILAEFDLTGWNLHNAGNDAVYTVHAMLAMCVNSAAKRGTGEIEARIKEDQERRLDSAIEDAKDRAQEDGEGWHVDGNEGGAGKLPGG